MSVENLSIFFYLRCFFFLWFVFIHAPAKSIEETSPKTTVVDWQIPCLQHQKFAASGAEAYVKSEAYFIR